MNLTQTKSARWLASVATMAVIASGAVVGIGAAAQAVDGTASQPVSDGGVTPYLIDGANSGGNIGCSEVGQAFFGDPNYYEFEAPSGGTGGNDYVSGNDFAQPWPAGLTVTVTDGKYVAFNSTFAIGAVIVKGSNDANNYVYVPQESADSGLASPINASGNPAGLSNLRFCWNDGDAPPASPLTVTKDASGSYDKTYTWDIEKDVDKTSVTKPAGKATFNYTVKVSHDDGTISNVKVTGDITVTNPNSADVTGVTVTDKILNGPNCTVTGGIDVTIPADSFKTFAYTCNLGNSLPSGPVKNTVKATWPEQDLGASGLLAAGEATFETGTIMFVATKIDECIDVDDSVYGALGTVCVGDDNPTYFYYSVEYNVPASGCVDFDNTATFTTNDTGTTGEDTVTVEVCGPIATGAKTIGFWQNKNGQGIITGGSSTAGVCNSATWLRQYAPFQDLSASANCRTTAAYVKDVIKAATAGGTTMNPMLKAQMLATSLDVYFSSNALGGNRIGAPAPIGGVLVDLTQICSNASCSVIRDASSVFGGSPKTVQQMLTYAASMSNVGGTSWYGQNKATQGLAKDAFDAINNEQVVGP